MEPLRNPRLADSIADHLEQLILEGVLRPGERLASERELADKFEISRPSLREALESLQRRGLLETTKSGTYVAKFMAPLTEPLAAMLQSNEQALIDYLEYRGLIEGEAARLAALRATDYEIEAIRACL
jgi:GntR family transcriptional repressor for pyruvate dehydrogenase complex